MIADNVHVKLVKGLSVVSVMVEFAVLGRSMELIVPHVKLYPTIFPFCRDLIGSSHDNTTERARKVVFLQFIGVPLGTKFGKK